MLLGNSFCQLSLLRFYANLDENYDVWVVQFSLFVKLQLLTCKGGLGHVAFHSIILFENLAIPWLVARLAYVNNVDNVMRNNVCSRKWNFHVRISVNTVACHAVSVCKYANLHVVTIISWKTLFVTKSDFFTSIWVIKFSISQFHIIYVTFHMPRSFENTAQRLREL